MALVASAGLASAAEIPQVVVSSNLLSDTSLVPGGFEEERFNSDIGELYRSPSGNRWISSFTTNFARVGIIIGEGASFEVALLVTGGDELPWSTFEEPAIYDSGLADAYAINDAGDIAISLVERTAPPTRIIAKRVGGTWSTVVRQGEDVPFDAADEVWGNLFFPFGINQDGSEVYYRAANTVGSLPDTQDEFIVLGSTVIQLGVTTLPSTAGRTFDNLGNSNYIRTAQDASSWIGLGNLSGATSDDDVIVSEAAIILQEGVDFDGYISRASRMGGPAISASGAYYAFRSQTADGTDFAGTSDGVVAFKGGTISDAPIGTTWNSFTNFSRTFLNLDINNQGDWTILGGTSVDGANVGRIVSSFDGVLISDRDGVDLDGNGLADDGVYADINGGTGGELSTHTLSSDGVVYAVVRLVDSPEPSGGAFLGEALVRVGPPISSCPVCAADYDGNGGVDGGDLGAFFTDFESGLDCADVDGNGGIDGGDLATFFLLFEAGGC
jgi:hypothetical protein